MTEIETEDPGLTVVRVRELRDQLRQAGPGQLTTGDLADMLDQLLGEDTRDRQDAALAASRALLAYGVTDGLAQTFAEQAVAAARPVIAFEEIWDLAELIGHTPFRCPVHDDVDCTPARNGCDLPAAIPTAVAGFIRSVASNYAVGDTEAPATDDDEEEMGQ